MLLVVLVVNGRVGKASVRVMKRAVAGTERCIFLIGGEGLFRLTREEIVDVMAEKCVRL